ncbi:MAG TPA: hypothetical protein VJM48_09545 [Methylibium sp.]|nr:hypothetical protein [Methylibium sp.]
METSEPRSVLSWLLMASVFLMMVCVGMGLSLAHFKALVRQPRPLWVGLACQLVVAPACGLALAWLYRDRPEIALGLVLLVAAPGGAVANGIVQFARGRVDVSVTLTALNGLSCMLLTPAIAALGFAVVGSAAGTLRVPVWDTVQRIVLLVALPVAAGMLLRARLGDGSRWVEAAHGAAAALVAVVLGIVLVTIADHLAMHWASHLPAALMLCTLMLGLSYGGAAAAGLDRPLRFTVAIEAGIHNVPIVVLLADQVLHRPELAGLAVVYVPVVAVMTLGWAALARRARRPSFGAGATPMPGPR